MSISYLRTEDADYGGYWFFVPWGLTLCSAFHYFFRYLWTSCAAKRTVYRRYAVYPDSIVLVDDEEERDLNAIPSSLEPHSDLTTTRLNAARLAGNLSLLVLSSITLWRDLGSSTSANYARYRLLLSSTSFYLWLSFVYTTILAFATLRNPTKRTVAWHANAILLAVLCIYLYRDVWPLATYDSLPLDVEKEGSLVWLKIVTLACTAVLIPVCIPRRYQPVDPKNPMTAPNPKHTASWLSRVTFMFLDPLIWRAYWQKTHWRHDQLPPLADCWEAKYHAQRAAKFLDPLSPERKPLALGLLRYFWRDYVSMGLSVCCSSVAGFAAPTALNKILRYLEVGPSSSTIRPWFWLVLFIFGPMVQSVCVHWFMSVGTTVHVTVRALVTQLVFEHTLRMRLPGVRRGEAGTSEKGQREDAMASQTGRINTLVTADLANIIGVVDILNFVIQIPMMVTFSIIFLYQMLGWSALVGAASIIVFVPIPGWIGKKITVAQRHRMKETDGRVQSISEAVSVMRMIKLFGWEQKMIGKIEEKRDHELSWIWKIMVLKIMNNVVGMLITSSTIFITYAVYTTVMKEELNASKIFSTMAVFDILRTQIQRVSWRMTTVIQAKVSFDRLDDFLTKTPLLGSVSSPSIGEELFHGTYGDWINGESSAIGFRNASFSWVSMEDDVLASRANPSSDFRLRINGELLFVGGGINVISGPTGSGKTSMLLALLSEMHYTPLATDSWFNLPRAGGVAYVSQESWVQNATVKDNILFGAPFDDQRYRKVLHQCALEQDIATFDGGDNAEVGERGITLSGGQKARLTLARAVYSKAGVLLLDDIFASLDAHTSAWIVDKCLRGELLQDRTIILVTHNVPLVIDLAHKIVAIGPDGTVEEADQSPGSGAIHDRARVAVASKLATDDSIPSISSQGSSPSSKPGPQADGKGKLVSAEDIAEGRISFKSFGLFLGALGGRHPTLFVASWILGVVLSRLILILRVWFLGFWGSQYENHAASEVPVQRFLQGFLAILAAGVLFTALTQIVYNTRVIRAARTVHVRLISSVFRATLRWLDETPGARIITRCTQDIRAVDEPIPTSAYEVLDAIVTALTKIGAIILFTPLFIIPAIVVSSAGVLIGSIYLRAQLAVKREMSNAQSPIIAHLNAAIQGLVSVRAYNATPAFIRESLSRIDHYSRAAHTCWNVNRWIGIRIDFLGSLFTGSLAAYLLYGASVSAANSGFALNMALEFCTYLFILIRTLNDLEVECNSLERIQGFLDIDHEPEPRQDNKIPAAWPTSGDLRVTNLSASYSRDGPKVLRDVSFHVASGERIGIVGRTGSGKSSLALSLLRCILTEGSICLDGRDTSLVNLDTLRSSITIIPQAPELLSGTLRQNLDPFGQHSDAVLIDALKSTGFFSLQQHDQSSDASQVTLDTVVTGSGANFSVGERQIIALARAMIRRSKVLILDEATSAIDHQTDSIIQENLRQQAASDVTVLTIAHRIQTVMDADRIMVLDNGQVVEFDTPKRLLGSDDSSFKRLVDRSLKKAKGHQN